MSVIKTHIKGEVNLELTSGRALGNVIFDFTCQMGLDEDGLDEVKVEDVFIQNDSWVQSTDTLVEAMIEAVEDNFPLWESFAKIDKEN